MKRRQFVGALGALGGVAAAVAIARPAMSRTLTEKEKRFIEDALMRNIPERLKMRSLRAGSCSCSGCSCPSGHGDICDAGTYTGTAGGYYGANIG
jgi:hypothetical protein